MQNNVDRDATYEKVIEFLCSVFRFKSEDLDFDVSFFHDLGVDGDDGQELLSQYSKKFNVDVSEVSFELYFGSESSVSPLVFIRWLFCKSVKVDKRRLTVGDLVEGVKSGVLKPAN